MNDEQLIECVRQYPILYDLSNPKYMDIAFKNEIWSKIGEEMKKDGKYQLVNYNFSRCNNEHLFKHNLLRFLLISI